MELSNLPSTNKKNMRRLGQGHGSGRGKTSGRGTKGQKARNKVPTFFEGGALPLTKRLPFLRGRGRNKIRKSHPLELNIVNLSRLSSNAIVDVETLVAQGIVGSEAISIGVKLIGSTKVDSKFDVKIPVSAGARKSILASGGTVS